MSTKSQSHPSRSSHLLQQLREADGDVSKNDAHFPLASLVKHATCVQQQHLAHAHTSIWPKSWGKESQFLCFSICLPYLNNYNIAVYRMGLIVMTCVNGLDTSYILFFLKC